ncbi:MAG: tetratricopeptide repeat-containing sensor histidine kinase, partial [Tannerella sp.]|nr:tetratricopeptide repeat-containing sensor histidine kinase [Tannerella sp.]
MKRVLIALMMFAQGQAQGQDIDSLYHLYTDAKGDRRVALVNEMAQAAYRLECSDTLYRIERDTKPELVAAIAHELMAGYNEYIANDLHKVVQFSLEAAQLFEQAGDTLAMDDNYHRAGANYYRMGDYETAVSMFLKCYELEKQMNNAPALSSTLNSLGIVYSNWGKSEKAIEYFREAVERERPLNRPLQYAGRLSSLAKETALLGNADEGLRLIREALAYDEKLEGTQRSDRIAAHQLIMGDIYVLADSLPQAEKCYQHAVSVFEKLNRQQLLAASLLSLGKLYLQQKRFPAAIETLKNCMTICEKINLQRTRHSATRYLYEAYKQTGNLTQALAYLEQYRDLNDVIFQETAQKQISEFQVKYETAQKDLELERRQSKIDRQNTRQNYLIGGILIFALAVALLVIVVRNRNRRNRYLAETNATKDKYFSIISHDLKNPAIMQCDALQSLLDNAGKWDAAALTRYYQKLLASAKGQLNLLYSLLDWAQTQAGRMPYTPVEFDLTAALKQSDAGFIQDMANEKGVIFDMQIPETALTTGDCDMLTTVVRNLLTNAVKFTATGGTVTLEISPACSGEKSPAHTKITVSDTGTGMSAE